MIVSISPHTSQWSFIIILYFHTSSNFEIYSKHINQITSRKERQISKYKLKYNIAHIPTSSYTYAMKAGECQMGECNFFYFILSGVIIIFFSIIVVGFASDRHLSLELLTSWYPTKNQYLTIIH